MHVTGGVAEISGVILCVVIDNFPELHFQPNIIVVLGHINVLGADRVKLFSYGRHFLT